MRRRVAAVVAALAALGLAAGCAAGRGATPAATGSRPAALDGARVRRAVELIWQQPEADNEAWQASLVKAGYSQAEAELLVFLVPEAFALPVLEKLGIHGAPYFLVPIRTKEREKVDWRAWPVFTAALEAGRAKRVNGLGEAYQAIAGRSAGMASLGNALEGGESLERLKGSKAVLAFVAPYPEELGPLPIYKETDESSMAQLVASLEGRPEWLFGAKGCPADAIGPERHPEAGEDDESCRTQPGRCAEKCLLAFADGCYWLAIAAQAAMVPVDLSEALYQRACALGAASGCTNRAAGMIVARGVEDPAALTCAARTFQVACARRDPWGCTMVASALAHGRGVPQDLEAALKALEGSCKHGPEDPACKQGMELRERLERALAGSRL